MPIVSVDDERALAESILLALGAPAPAATAQTEWLLEGDLRGHPSHGLQRLIVIAERIARGLSDPGAEPTLEWVSPSALLVDGHRGLGPCVGLAAVQALIEAAPTAGVTLAAVRDANHLGLLAPYVERCAERGLIGIALTTSEALVHPWGGRIAQLGTNPIAVAMPAEPAPFVFDMATGIVSMGKVLDHRHRGAPLPQGWAVDAGGDPTTDAAAAAEGAIAPFGAGKGYGLGLAFELLVGALTSTALGRAVHGTLDVTEVCNKGDVFLCLDPAAFGAEGIAARLGVYLDELRATPPQADVDAVLVPGDRARAERARRLRDGVPIADGVWDTLRELAERLHREAVA